MSEKTHVEELLGAYLDGELDASSRTRVEAHLRLCTLCGGQLEELRRLDADLRRVAAPDPGPAYWSTFTARLESRLSAASGDGLFRRLERVSAWFLPAGRPAWPRVAGAMALVTLVTFVGLQGFRSEDVGLPQSPPPPETEPRAPLHGSRQSTPVLDEAGRRSKSEAADEQPAAPEVAVEAGKELASARSASEEALGEMARERGIDSVAAAQEAWAKAPQEPESQMAQAGEAAPGRASSAPDTGVAAALPAFSATPEERRLAERAVALRRLSGSLATSEVDLATDRSAAESFLRGFVQAALAGDTLVASYARDQYAARAAAQATELAAMQTWLGPQQDTHAVDKKSSVEAFAATRAPSSAVAAPLLALDELVWPRRDDALLRPMLEELARRLVQESQARPASRERARVYLEWLAAHATDPLSRAVWRRQLELLPP